MWSIIFLILLLFLVIGFFNQSEAFKNWSTLVANLNYDPNIFYTEVELNLRAKNISGIHISRINLKEGAALSYHREYLEISRRDYIFHICAAPFGTDFFFSYWLRKKVDVTGNILVALPYIGKYFVDKVTLESYYKLDTDAMFKLCVHEAIIMAIDNVTKASGIKELSESQRMSDIRNIL